MQLKFFRFCLPHISYGWVWVVTYQHCFKPTELIFRNIQGHLSLVPDLAWRPQWVLGMWMWPIMPTPTSDEYSQLLNWKLLISALRKASIPTPCKCEPYVIWIWTHSSTYREECRFARDSVRNMQWQKNQIPPVISKYLLDLFPPHPSAQYYISLKCNKSYWGTGLKDIDFLSNTHLLVRWVLGVIPSSPKRVTKTLASVPAPRTSPVTVTTS